MSDLSSQRRLAAEILDCGVGRVWIEPGSEDAVGAAITRADVRNLISKGMIAKRQKKGTSRLHSRERAEKKKKGRLRRAGSKRGSETAEISSKRRWINTIRPIRRYIKALKLQKKLETAQYRKLYMLAKGGYFRNKTHLNIYLRKEGLVK